MPVTASSLERCPHCAAPDIVTRGEHVECLHCRKVIVLSDLTPCRRCGEILPSASSTCPDCAPQPEA